MEIQNSPNLKTQKGFSLIELLIAIPIGLLVMFAVLRIFTANIHGVSIQNSFSRVQENGRMAVELMTRDIRSADYWGCVNNIDSITNDLDSSDADYDADLVPNGQQGITGENDVSSTTIEDLDDSTEYEVKDNTDTLTLWGSKSFPNAKIKSDMSSTSDDISFTTGSGVSEGDMLVIADCENIDLFTNTSSTDGTIKHGISSSSGINNSTDVLSQTYETNAVILAPHVKTYFISDNSADSYSLYRRYDGAVSELIRGVNDLQILYGEDTTDNGSADTYSNADNVNDMDDVVTVRVSITSDSGSDDATSSATSLERTYTATTNIRNRSLD